MIHELPDPVLFYLAAHVVGLLLAGLVACRMVPRRDVTEDEARIMHRPASTRG